MRTLLPTEKLGNNSLGLQVSLTSVGISSCIDSLSPVSRGWSFARRMWPFQVLGNGAEFGREGSQLLLKKKMGGRKYGCFWEAGRRPPPQAQTARGPPQISAIKRNSNLTPYFKTQNRWRKLVMNKISTFQSQDQPCRTPLALEAKGKISKHDPVSV